MCHDPQRCDEAIEYWDALWADEAEQDALYAQEQAQAAQRAQAAQQEEAKGATPMTE